MTEPLPCQPAFQSVIWNRDTLLLPAHLRPDVLTGPAQSQGGAKSLHCRPVPGEFAWLWRPECPLVKDKWLDLRCDWTREGLYFKSQLRTNTQQSNCDYSKPWKKPCCIPPAPAPTHTRLSHVACSGLTVETASHMHVPLPWGLIPIVFLLEIFLLRYWMGSVFKHRFL